jgi:hypothetical protein
VHRVDERTDLGKQKRRQLDIKTKSSRVARRTSTRTSGFCSTTIFSKSFSGRYSTLLVVVNGPHAVTMRTALPLSPWTSLISTFLVVAAGAGIG